MIMSARILLAIGSLTAALALAAEPAVFGLPAKEETSEMLITRSAKHVPEWGLWLLTEKRAVKNSDHIRYFLSLRTKDGPVVARYDSLVGPVLASPINRQIFSCEENVVDQTEHAELLDLRGNISHRIAHQGFSRNCGLTDDKKLYWLEYSNSDDGKVAWSIILVVDKVGQIVNKSVLKKAGSVIFAYDGKTYKLSFSTPVLPG